jgi:hypothetical protein
MTVVAQPIRIELGAAEPVSGLWQLPAAANACFVMAHGAGAGMTHPFMASMANELAALAVATLRYQFPYVEHGGKRPDPEAVCHATVRAAVATAAALAPALPQFAGGRSFGGRMTSQAQAAAELAGVRGLVFLGFPLHPAGKPAITRAQHLQRVNLPMLFLQGTRDALAELPLLQPVIEQLGARARLELIDGADHSYHVLRSSGTTDAQVRSRLATFIAGWIREVVRSGDQARRMA